MPGATMWCSGSLKGTRRQYRPIASVGAACGLRQGELFGLAEEDIDLDEMVIHVRRLLFRWTDDKHTRARAYDELV